MIEPVMYLAIGFLVAMLLSLMGNDARTAHDGLEAVEVAEAFRPEVIVLDVGLELKVISPELFSMMVIMALVTTVATTPVVGALVPSARGPGSGSSPPTSSWWSTR